MAPSGLGGRRVGGWIAPVSSVARTSSRCSPGCASQVHTHWRQVSVLGAAPSRASFHGPPSTRTSTRAMPRCCAQATPATAAGPAGTWANGRGTSIREKVRTGACGAQPRRVQYACARSKRVTSRSVSHLVAET